MRQKPASEKYKKWKRLACLVLLCCITALVSGEPPAAAAPLIVAKIPADAPVEEQLKRVLEPVMAEPIEIAEQETMLVPEAEEPVEEDYFADVLFIGDSRTVGLREYARLGDADYFCSVGMTVFDATEQELSDRNFSATNLEGLLRSKRYNKIYISLGLNECGYPYDLLMEGYESLLNMVRKHQPHAVIILHGMITVS